MLLFSFSGQILSLAENPAIPDGSRALPDTQSPISDETKPAILGDQQHYQKAWLLRQHVRVVFSICQDSSFFLGMDKHIKQKRKKNLKRKLLPSDSAIDKGKGH